MPRRRRRRRRRRQRQQWIIDSLPTQKKLRGRGNKTVVGTIVKSNIGELEEEVRAGILISMRS